MKPMVNGSRGIPSEQRVCQVCDCGIEDELHLFAHCAAYDRLRQNLMTSIRTHQPDMLEGNDVDVFCRLMASEDKVVIKKVGDFLWYSFKLRRQVLSQKGIMV